MSGWTVQKTFGARVSDKLRLRNWSVKDLALLVNCSPGYLYRVVRGEQEPAWSLAVNIAKALGCVVDELSDDFTVLDNRCAFCGREYDIKRK